MAIFSQLYMRQMM